MVQTDLLREERGDEGVMLLLSNQCRKAKIRYIEARTTSMCISTSMGGLPPAEKIMIGAFELV